MKKGLILEGGAMRGLFSAGVMDVLMENKVSFDGAVGVSAGAAFGVNYKSGQIGRAIRYNLQFCRDKRYCGIGSLLKTGNIYNTDFCYGEVPLKLDVFDFKAYTENPMEFYVVCTDIVTGEAVYHKYDSYEDHGFDWIRASASMPLVSQIVKIDDLLLLDGGISDSIPIRYFESIGYTRNVAILTQPEGYRKEKNSVLPLIRRKYRAYPKLVEAMEKRHLVYNEELDDIAKKEAAGQLFVIRPESPLPVSRIEKDSEKLRLTYEIGRNTAIEKLSSLKAFLD
ncbi:MAG: patatin family protein [Fusicatenibacter sp.]|nr:patatin family protein [Lachnospiraceae bacterium]MDY2939100.1 patatin family protein [Fusicatenibacter sp.]